MQFAFIRAYYVSRFLDLTRLSYEYRQVQVFIIEEFVLWKFKSFWMFVIHEDEIPLT